MIAEVVESRGRRNVGVPVLRLGGDGDPGDGEGKGSCVLTRGEEKKKQIKLNRRLTAGDDILNHGWGLLIK